MQKLQAKPAMKRWRLFCNDEDQWKHSPPLLFFLFLFLSVWLYMPPANSPPLGNQYAGKLGQAARDGNGAAADEHGPRECSNWIKFSTIRFRRLLTGEKAEYFSLSTNLLPSYTTPMQPQPQLYAVNNKQIYFHQPC